MGDGLAGKRSNGASVEIDGAAEEKSISPLHKDIAAGEGEDESSDDSEGADENVAYLPLELAVAWTRSLVELFMPKTRGGGEARQWLSQSESRGVSTGVQQLPPRSPSYLSRRSNLGPCKGRLAASSRLPDGSLANRKPGRKDKQTLASAC